MIRLYQPEWSEVGMLALMTSVVWTAVLLK